MEDLLRAQKTLEKAEEVFTQHMAVEAIEGAHTRFLSGLRPITSPEASYLLTVGRLSIRPFLSPPGPSRDFATPMGAYGDSGVRGSHTRPSHAVA